LAQNVTRELSPWQKWGYQRISVVLLHPIEFSASDVLPCRSVAAFFFGDLFENHRKPLQAENSMERTLSIVKPDATAKNKIGAILDRLESAGLKIVAGQMMHLTTEQAEKFYDIHKERPFFGELVEYMTSGPVFVSVLEGVGAVLKNREIMGATDPKKADAGTIRADFGDSIAANAVHGSDSVENALAEIAQFFPGLK
jgi:nucleoside-diphosphate kinase